MITKDVETIIPKTKEATICKAQHFNLTYNQLGCLYTVIPYALYLCFMNQDTPSISHSIDEPKGVVFHQGNIPKPHISLPYNMT